MYSTATSISDANTNLSSLDANGSSLIYLKIIFDDSATQSSIDNATINYNGSLNYYSEGSIETSYFVTAEISSFSVSGVTVPGSDYIGYYAIAAGSKKYWNGTSWVSSDGFSESQTNDYSTFSSNIASLVSDHTQIQLGIYLKSNDGSTTPSIDYASFTYNFGALRPSDPQQCQAYMYFVDAEDNPIENVSVSISIYRGAKQYIEAADNILYGTITKTSDDEGFVSFNLIRSSEFETEDDSPMQYKLTYTYPSGEEVSNHGYTSGGEVIPILFTVPDQVSVNITDQISGY